MRRLVELLLQLATLFFGVASGVAVSRLFEGAQTLPAWLRGSIEALVGFVVTFLSYYILHRMGLILN